MRNAARVQQDRVHHAKHSNVRADAQRQRQRCHHHKTRAVAQTTRRVTEIVKCSRHFVFLPIRTSAPPWDRLSLPDAPECSWPGKPPCPRAKLRKRTSPDPPRSLQTVGST